MMPAASLGLPGSSEIVLGMRTALSPHAASPIAQIEIRTILGAPTPACVSKHANPIQCNCDVASDCHQSRLRRVHRLEVTMSENDYLAQVMAKQQRVEVDLRAKRASPAANRMALACAEPQQAFEAGALRAHTVGRAAPDMETPAVDVRITGWWRWKTVVVPPNAHVVHTRRGHARPLHIGLGVSFGYDPAKDSFLVVPGTMQTIMINAYCICRELQGLLVQGYVQWIIADFATAYQKLDFTDAEDPMRVVNVQLREQAEAAIKDKVATMGIDEVLSDKQPIIQELTARLRSVAEGEGEGEGDTGLGLRIVTVQIKEAVVSSRGDRKSTRL